MLIQVVALQGRKGSKIDWKIVSTIRGKLSKKGRMLMMKIVTIVVALLLPGIAQATECSNDYSCGYNQVCVKTGYSSTGICATKVDRYGLPTYDSNKRGNFGPHDGSGNCSFDTDCDVGFRCYKNGAIYGRCMKK
jgi:hypothetical protein